MKRNSIIRAVFLALMLMVQLIFLVWAAMTAGRLFLSAHLLLAAVNFLFALLIINSRRPPEYKLLWLMTVSVLPVIGAAVYILWRLSGAVKRRLCSTAEIILTDDAAVTAAMDSECGELSGLARYISRCGGFPAYFNTSAEYYPLGEMQFEAVLREMEKAQRFIFMEYFIVRDGFMFGAAADLLIKKAQSGVDVRLLYDGIGTGMSGCGKIIETLKSGGVKCREFNPLSPFLTRLHNNRDHRKIIIIDGETAFSGGTNIADEYINRLKRFGHWKDTAVMLRGSAVRSYTVMFMQLWEPLSGSIGCEYLPPPGAAAEVGDGFVQPFSDSPLDNETIGRQAYLELINAARRSICIMTPYFIPDDELMNALIFTAKKGVDVRLITPHIPDKRCVWIVTRSYFPRLISGGVKVYSYTPGFIHAKCCICDDIAAVIGSINFDYRSFYMHFETAAVFYKCRIIGDMKRDFELAVQCSSLVTAEDCRRISAIEKFLAAILRMFAPMM